MVKSMGLEGACQGSSQAPPLINSMTLFNLFQQEPFGERAETALKVFSKG